MSRHKKKQRSVRILNPIRGGKKHTGQARALEYVREGRADWVGGDAIVFVEQHQRHQAAAAHSLIPAPRPVAPGDLATLDAIAGIPVLMPVKLITDRNSPITRKGRPQRGRSGRVVIVKSGVKAA